MGNRTKYFLLNLFLIIAVSCGDQPTCVDKNSSTVKISFIDSDGDAKTITLLGLRAVNNEMGFPDYADTTVSSLSLPLNPGANMTTFLLDQEDKTDTLGLSYDVVSELISPECGLRAAYSKLDTTATSFTALEIVSRIIHDEITTNIEITH